MPEGRMLTEGKVSQTCNNISGEKEKFMKSSYWPSVWRSGGGLFPQSIDDLFSRFLSEPVTYGASQAMFNPPVDVEEKSDHYLISMDLPGVKKEDVRIEVKGSDLMISGEKRHEKEVEKEGRYYCERSAGSFQRTFTLPGEVKSDSIEAVYTDGVLRLAVPKVAEMIETPKRVKIGEGKAGVLGKLLSRKEEKKGEKAA